MIFITHYIFLKWKPTNSLIVKKLTASLLFKTTDIRKDQGLGSTITSLWLADVFPSVFTSSSHTSYISICRIQNDQLWKWKRGTLHCARKRNGNYGQCQIIELVVRDMLITDRDAEDLSLRTRGDRLSLLLMSCFREEIVPRKHHRYYKLASCSLVYPILLELTESNWPAHIHALYFLYSHQQCR